MAKEKSLKIAVVGLGFGAEFVPIYLDHPHVGEVVACDTNPERLRFVKNRFPNIETATSFDALLDDPSIDAIHILSGIPDHASQSVRTLISGKHCACTVPAATTIDDLRAIVEAEEESSKRYMMMETAVYTRQFLFAEEMRRLVKFGKIQFLRGAHYQDMRGWPPYWDGLPPMHYATHAVSPLLSLLNARAKTVRCLGSGTMSDDLVAKYGNPYPVETAIFEIDDFGISAEVTRTLFECARPYMESFTVYGTKSCYEWQLEEEPPMLFEAEIFDDRPMGFSTTKPETPDRTDLLPEPLRKYTRRFVYGEDSQHLSFAQGGGHHGSHPYLIHEFVSSIVEDRPARINAKVAADWCAVGIMAHESAMQGGMVLEVPSF